MKEVLGLIIIVKVQFTKVTQQGYLLILLIRILMQTATGIKNNEERTPIFPKYHRF